MWLLWPGVFRITPAQLATQLWIQPVPETCQIAGLLYGSLIGREEMHENGNAASRNGRRLCEPEEILKTRCDPRRLIAHVVHLHLPRSQRQPLGGNLVQSVFTFATEPCSKDGDQ